MEKRKVYCIEDNEEYPIFSFSEDDLYYKVNLMPKLQLQIKKIFRLHNSIQQYLKDKSGYP